MIEGLHLCRKCGQAVSNEAMTCPHCSVARPTERHASWRGRDYLIAGVVTLTAVLTAVLAATNRQAGQPTVDRWRSVSHNEGERYTVTAGTTACEALSDFRRIVELARTDDTTAFNTFLIVSTCHVVQHPTLAIYEGQEPSNIARVRAPGSITSWYMFEKGLQ